MAIRPCYADRNGKTHNVIRLTMSHCTIRPIENRDRAQWDILYAGYAQFYRVTQTAAMRNTVWSWLHDAHHETCGLVAENRAGKLVGLAHFRAFARPLSATTGCFLDDLFVAPEARGTKVADALLQRLHTLAQEKGWSMVRWITAEDNYRARAVYDRLAAKTHWLTYDMKVG